MVNRGSIQELQAENLDLMNQLIGMKAQYDQWKKDHQQVLEQRLELARERVQLQREREELAREKEAFRTQTGSNIYPQVQSYPDLGPAIDASVKLVSAMHNVSIGSARPAPMPNTFAPSAPSASAPLASEVLYRNSSAAPMFAGNSKSNRDFDGLYFQKLILPIVVPFEFALENGFGPGSVLQISSIKIHTDADRIVLNFACDGMNKFRKSPLRLLPPHEIRQDDPVSNVAFHFNPRFDQHDVIVRNTYRNHQWENEERCGGNPLRPGSDFSLMVKSEDRGYRVFVNNREFTFYRHRIPVENVTNLVFKGSMTVSNLVYKSKHFLREFV